MPKPKMTIALVTTYPPSQGSLNEYAYHFVRCLRDKAEVREIILLTDILPETPSIQYMLSTEASPVPIRVIPCWRFGAWTNPLRILAAIKKVQPDIVLFNLQFATFGDRKIPAALGLMTPACVRLLGLPTVVLLHHLMEKIDLKSAGFGSSIEHVIRFFGTVITRLLLMTDLVTLTMPNYVEFLTERYGVNNVALAPHGAFAETLTEPPHDVNSSGKHVVMTFGKFGTYKRVEQLLEAVALLQTQGRAIELVIAGTDSPNARGYLDAMKQRYAHVAHVTYTGYVPEEQVARVFEQATLVVFPYISTTGSSGVLHQAGEYGKAVVLPYIGDFAEVIAEEGYRGSFFEAGSVASLGQAIAALLDNPQERAAIGRHNYSAAHSLPMSDVVDWYLVHFQYLLNCKQRRKIHAVTDVSDKYYYHPHTHGTV